MAIGLVLVAYGAPAVITDVSWMLEHRFLWPGEPLRLMINAERYTLGGTLLAAAVWALRPPIGGASLFRRGFGVICLVAGATLLWRGASRVWGYLITGGLWDGFTLFFVGWGMLDVIRGLLLVRGVWLLSPIWSQHESRGDG